MLVMGSLRILSGRRAVLFVDPRDVFRMVHDFLGLEWSRIDTDLSLAYGSSFV